MLRRYIGLHYERRRHYQGYLKYIYIAELQRFSSSLMALSYSHSRAHKLTVYWLVKRCHVKFSEINVFRKQWGLQVFYHAIGAIVLW